MNKHNLFSAGLWKSFLSSVVGLACVACAASIVTLMTPCHVSAATLVYYADDDGGGNPQALYNFNTTTGVSTLRVPVSKTFDGMAVRPSDGTVFATSILGVGNGDTGLYTLNINTGASSLVGVMPGPDPTELLNIAFDPTTNILYGTKINTGQLFTINQSTAQPTLVGDSVHVRGVIDFGPNGTLFGFDANESLYTISTSNASDALIGGSGHALIEDAAMTKAGELFITGFSGDILQVDTATGSRTIVGTRAGFGNGAGLRGVLAVPEPSTFTLAALGLLGVLISLARGRENAMNF